GRRRSPHPRLGPPPPGPRRPGPPPAPAPPPPPGTPLPSRCGDPWAPLPRPYLSPSRWAVRLLAPGPALGLGGNCPGNPVFSRQKGAQGRPVGRVDDPPL